MLTADLVWSMLSGYARQPPADFDGTQTCGLGRQVIFEDVLGGTWKAVMRCAVMPRDFLL